MDPAPPEPEVASRGSRSTRSRVRTGLLPLGVPEVDPKKVAVIFVNEDAPGGRRTPRPRSSARAGSASWDLPTQVVSRPRRSRASPLGTPLLPALRARLTSRRNSQREPRTSPRSSRRPVISAPPSRSGVDRSHAICSQNADPDALLRGSRTTAVQQERLVHPLVFGARVAAAVEPRQIRQAPRRRCGDRRPPGWTCRAPTSTSTGGARCTIVATGRLRRPAGHNPTADLRTCALCGCHERRWSRCRYVGGRRGLEHHSPRPTPRRATVVNPITHHGEALHRQGSSKDQLQPAGTPEPRSRRSPFRMSPTTRLRPSPVRSTSTNMTHWPQTR